MNITPNKTRVLLVDDDEMMRILFRDIFWIHGRSDTYDVTMVSSLSEAEEKLMDKEVKPDIIFLDMMLPIKGDDNSPNKQIERTCSFINKVKKEKDFSHIKIIIYSGQKEESIKNEVCKLGVDGYLIKGEIMPKEIIDFTDKIHESNN